MDRSQGAGTGKAARGAFRVVVVNDTGVARGGASGLAVQQAKMMAGRGIDVTFFAADRSPNADFAGLGIKTRNAGQDPLTKAHPVTAASRGLYNRSVRDALAALIRETDTPQTIYHVHSWSKTLTAAAFTPLSAVAPRVFVHAHDFFLACPNGGFMDYQAQAPCARIPLSLACLATHCDKRSRSQKAWRVVRQLAINRSYSRSAPWAGIFLIHPKMREYFEKSGFLSDRLHVLRNPAEPMREERITAEANANLLYVGRLEPEKGVPAMLDAAKLAGVAMTVVGDGVLRNRLVAEYPEVRFMGGWLERADVASEMARARALVMPSLYPEPFGLVAAEASLSGLPVIASQSAFLAPEIKAAGLGETVDVTDRAAFADILRRFAHAPPSVIEAMSRAGSANEAGLCTTPEGWIDGILDYYETVLSTA